MHGVTASLPADGDGMGQSLLAQHGGRVALDEADATARTH